MMESSRLNVVVASTTIARAAFADRIPLPRRLDLARLWPLWRHAVWVVALFLVSAVAVSVRLDVHQLRRDLDRNARTQREAQVLNERLRLEIDARRRAVAVDSVADAMGMGADIRVVRLGEHQ